MIELKVEEYCQRGCPFFEPEVKEWHLSSSTNFEITCEHALKCEFIGDYLQEARRDAGGTR